MKTFKLIGLTISLLLAGSGVGLAQCPPNNFTMALPGMTSPNTFCYFKPFGVGRNSGNADLSFGDRGLLFCAYQSDDAKVRYRYPNYQPIGIEYHPWAQKLLFKITTGVQSPGTGN